MPKFLASLGFVAVPNPQQLGLPPGMIRDDIDVSPDAQVYGVSMLHQIHCLVLQLFYYLARNDPIYVVGHDPRDLVGTLLRQIRSCRLQTR